MIVSQRQHLQQCMEADMIIIRTIGRRGQMTVPRAIRRSLNLQQGDRVALILRGDEVVLQPLTQTLLDLRGSVPAAKVQDFGAIRDRVIQEQARQAAQSAD